MSFFLLLVSIQNTFFSIIIILLKNNEIQRIELPLLSMLCEKITEGWLLSFIPYSHFFALLRSTGVQPSTQIALDLLVIEEP